MFSVIFNAVLYVSAVKYKAEVLVLYLNIFFILRSNWE